MKWVGEPGLSLAGLRPALRAEFHLGRGWTRTGPGLGVFTVPTMYLSRDIIHVISRVSLNITRMSQRVTFFFSSIHHHNDHRTTPPTTTTTQRPPPTTIYIETDRLRMQTTGHERKHTKTTATNENDRP